MTSAKKISSRGALAGVTNRIWTPHFRLFTTGDEESSSHTLNTPVKFKSHFSSGLQKSSQNSCHHQGTLCMLPGPETGCMHTRRGTDLPKMPCTAHSTERPNREKQNLEELNSVWGYMNDTETHEQRVWILLLRLSVLSHRAYCLQQAFFWIRQSLKTDSWFALTCNLIVSPLRHFSHSLLGTILHS